MTPAQRRTGDAKQTLQNQDLCSHTRPLPTALQKKPDTLP